MSDFLLIKALDKELVNLGHYARRHDIDGPYLELVRNRILDMFGRKYVEPVSAEEAGNGD